MTQNKNPTTSPKEAKPETPLTEEQRQRRRKMLVYPLMGLLFLGSMWLIFAPSDKEKSEAQQGVGFNTEMPLPAESGIIADKRTAYERAQMEEKQRERRAQMNDLAALFSDKEMESDSPTEEFDLLDPEPQQPAHSYGGGSARQPIRSSAAAYEEINRTLGNFYETPKDDPEKEELRERIEELEAMMARQPNRAARRSTTKWPCSKSPTNWRPNICPPDRAARRNSPRQPIRRRTRRRYATAKR